MLILLLLRVNKGDTNYVGMCQNEGGVEHGIVLFGEELPLKV